jgi:hypothetical protein
MDAVNVAKKTSDGPAREQAVAAGSMDFNRPLTPESVSGSADGPPRCDHVVDDGHRLSGDVQILGFVNDGVCIDPCFFQVRNSQPIC